ncbi:YggT family protein [Comamonas endophytica]|uniref:YggT family protein n=1 Tax=Comamonas endophytica TaxID=2949090 RepID=A0ABY6GC39_9BURK|nr:MULTISPECIES: YggT family protein [unclassified Acidovorax]MCD2513528.1 YggT family protein [Acidovorax sp. D4N7]UYG52461.1 YggT family protein [Acidovorax sp. 5MLIR]
MLFQIITFLLDVAVGLLTGLCLLRLYMQAQRIPFSNPVGRLVFALTDWIVLPLRRIVPASGRWDASSAIAAYLLQLLQYVLLWLMMGSGASQALWLPWLALCGAARVVLTGCVGIVLVYVILSWVQSNSPMSAIMERLAEPLLRPVRRVVPLIGGIDLSPLVLLVLLQVALMVLAYLQAGVLR